MSVEKMACCGALTRVYADAGRRVHKPGCKGDEAVMKVCGWCGGNDPNVRPIRSDLGVLCNNSFHKQYARVLTDDREEEPTYTREDMEDAFAAGESYQRDAKGVDFDTWMKGR